MTDENKTKPCESCKDIGELEIDYPDEPHHGGIRECGDCGAEYDEEYGGEILAGNEEAKPNSPELKMV